MDPKNQPQFNPNIPISEVLKQEQAGFTPSAPKLNDVVAAIGGMQAGANNTVTMDPTPGTATTNSTPAGGAAGVGTTPQNQIRIIKTYRSDAAEAVKMQEQASVAKIAIAQEQQRRARGEEIGATPKKRTSLLLLAIILIIIGAAAIPTVQYILNLKKQEVFVNSEKTIVPFDHQETVTIDNTTRDELLGALGVLGTKQVPASKIEYIKFLENTLDANKKTVTKKITPDVFAKLIGPNMPSALARSFDSDYMYGVEDSNKSKLFIIFKTSSYQQTFANMLSWETKMITDLSPILNLGTDTVGRPFTDQVIINKDVRAITATDGTIIFLYGFLDNQTLIITTNSQTFQDINSRYVAARFVQ